MNKYCKKCGKQLDDDAKFCTECGASVGNVPSDDSENTDASAPLQTKQVLPDGITEKLQRAALAHKITSILGFILGGIMAVCIFLIFNSINGKTDHVTPDVGGRAFMTALFLIYFIMVAGCFAVAAVSIVRAKRIKKVLQQISVQPLGVTDFYKSAVPMVAFIVFGVLFFLPGAIGHIIELTARAAIVKNESLYSGMGQAVR